MSLNGRTLGDFAMEEKLGAGGMGEVYRARQISLDRIVAVKVLPKSLAAQPGFEERFRREARAAANLIHPNVIQVYYVGIDAESHTPYFAMEYVEGEDLQQRMRRLKSLPYEMSVEIMAGVASALATAQEKGIVHRDIKPSNIMIDKNEVVKVMDFGLAKATQDKSSSNLTQSGIIMGTPNYISPEAGRGDPIDSRSDIYSLGVVFYELLTGMLPFTAETPAAIIYKHVYEPPPPPGRMNEACPPFLNDICLRMIAKDPKDRYPNAKALLSDLNEFKRSPDYYLQGGERRAPAIGTGSVSGDSTLVSSGTFPGKAGPGSRSGAETQAFSSAETDVDGAPSSAVPPTRANATVEAPSRLPAMIGGLIVLAAAGAIAFAMFKPTPPPANTTTNTNTGTTTSASTGVPGAKATFAASKLERLLKGGAEAFIQQGFEQKKVPTFDVQVDAGDYTLVFNKPGYEAIQRTFRIEPGKTSPPLEEVQLEWKPTEELRRTVDAGKRAIEDRKYREAIALLQAVVDKAPDYEPAVVALGLAKQRQSTLNADFQSAQRLYNDRKWAEALEALKALPPTVDQPEAVTSMIGSAEVSIQRLKEHFANLERNMQSGLYPAATATLDEIADLSPARDPALKAMREKIQEGERLFALGRTELEAGRYEEARTAFDALLKLSPGHREGGILSSRARGELDKQLSASQKVESAIKAGHTALDGGQVEVAAAEARRALAIDPENPSAKSLLSLALTRLAEQEITLRLVALDAAFRAMQDAPDRRYALLEMLEPAAREAVRADVESFAVAPIEVKDAAHKDMAVRITEAGGIQSAEVECTWNVVLRFTVVDRTTTLSVRQKFGMRKSGENWLITSVEQVGKANVQ